MSRIQTRVSDFGTATARRPIVDGHVGGPGPLSCSFRIRQTAATGVESGGLWAPGEGQTETIVACVGGLFECQYQLKALEGKENPSQRRPMAFPSPESAVGEGRATRANRGRPAHPEPVRIIEHSLLWQTSGKGDRDFGIHFFERRKFNAPKDPTSLDWQLPYQAYEFRAVCPPSPLTYHGHLVAIHWMVRVRVFLRSGREQSFEQPFVLVPDANRGKDFQ